MFFAGSRRAAQRSLKVQRLLYLFSFESDDDFAPDQEHWEGTRRVGFFDFLEYLPPLVTIQIIDVNTIVIYTAFVEEFSFIFTVAACTQSVELYVVIFHPHPPIDSSEAEKFVGGVPFFMPSRVRAKS